MACYFLHRNNENHGPYEESQVREFLAQEQVRGEELICLEGGSNWVPAASLLQAPPMAAVGGQPVPALAGGVSPGTGLPEKKGSHGCLKWFFLGLGFLVIVGIVGFFMKSQDDNLRAYGIAEIEKLPITGDKKLISLALAEHCHLTAANSGTRTSKKSFSTVSESEYWAALQNEMSKELRFLKSSGSVEDPGGGQFLYRHQDEGSFYLLKFQKNGSYRKEKFWTRPKDGDSPVEEKSGTWELSSGQLVLNPSSGSRQSLRILLLERGGFIVASGESETVGAQYWKRRS